LIDESLWRGKRGSQEHSGSFWEKQSKLIDGKKKTSFFSRGKKKVRERVCSSSEGPLGARDGLLQQQTRGDRKVPGVLKRGTSIKGNIGGYFCIEGVGENAILEERAFTKAKSNAGQP